jgi:methionyl-tRNA formyltransferase
MNDNTKRKKVLFLGQKPLGEGCFHILEDYKQLDIVGAVSNVDIDKTWWKTNKIYSCCKEKNIPFIENSRRNEESIRSLIQETDADVLLSIQHPWILSPSLLKLVNYNALNLHMAKLPDYKGWNGFSHAILNEDNEYYITLHWISDDLDGGDYAYETAFAITAEDTALSLYHKGLGVSFQMFLKMLADLTAAKVPRFPQKTGGKLYGRNSLEIYKYIPVEELAEKGNKIIRALYFPPYSPPYTILNELRVSLHLQEF